MTVYPECFRKEAGGSWEEGDLTKYRREVLAMEIGYYFQKL